MQDQYQKLKAALPNLGPKDQEFAQSLLDWCDQKGGWTPNQEKWVPVLIERGEKAAQPKPQAEVGDMHGVLALFATAKQHLKYPAIVLNAADNGDEIKIKPAPAGGKNPGCIYVYYEGAYRGKITPDGKWMPLQATDLQGFIWCMLKQLQQDPAGVAAAHGKLTGKCCFCNTKLTDPKSTSVGYGPVCAKHYDLPWGEPVTVGTAAATDVLNEMEQVKLNELAGELVDEVAADAQFEQGIIQVPDPDPADEDVDALVAEAATPIQTQLDEPASQSPVAEPEEPEPLPEPKPPVEFDRTPGNATRSLMEALSAQT